MRTEDLSPGFQRQLETLRKRVLYKMQTRTIHGRAITGRVLVNLARQYVQAFNTGTVPNIESAWTYITRNESMKALALARDQFKSVLDSKLEIPCALLDLESDYREAKREALQLYRERAIFGDDTAKKGEQIVKNECRDIYAQVKAKNDETCALACTEFLNPFHEEVMKSLATEN